MDVNIMLDIQELEAIAVCEQNDGYLKLWAKEKLEEMQYSIEFVNQPAKTLVAA